MVIKSNNNKTRGRVKFISYTGDWPNLCSGVLTLEIDGVQYKFGHEYMNYHIDDNGVGRFTDEDPDNPNYPSFWSSGGNVSHDGHWNWNVETGEWKIREEDLDPKFWDYVAEIDEVFNANVRWGCCGGCI